MKEKAKSRLLARAAVEMPDRVVLDSSVIAAVFFQEDDDSVRLKRLSRMLILSH